MLSIEESERIIIEKNIHFMFDVRTPENISMMDHMPNLSSIADKICKAACNLSQGRKVKFIFCDTSSFLFVDMLAAIVHQNKGKYALDLEKMALTWRLFIYWELTKLAWRNWRTQGTCILSHHREIDE